MIDIVVTFNLSLINRHLKYNNSKRLLTDGQHKENKIILETLQLATIVILAPDAM